MKLLKKEDRTLLTVLITVVVTVVLCLLLWFFLENQIGLLKEGYINGIAKNNEYIVNQVKSRIENEAVSEQDVVDIVKAAKNTGTRYWMLFSSDRVIFERDGDVTALVSGMDFEELERYYTRMGSDGAGPLVDLIQAGEFFSADVVKDVTAGNELITAAFVTVDGRTYCVATSILESYLFSSAKIGERIILLRILFAAMSALLIVFSAYLASKRRSEILKLQKLQDDLKEKNLLVLDHYGDGFQGDKEYSDRQVNSKDPLTGFYNNEFFETVLQKLSLRDISQIGAIVVRISNFYEIGKSRNAEYINQVMIGTTAIIKSHAGAKDICARVRAQEFVLIKLETTDKLTLQTARNIFRDLRDLDTNAGYTAGFAYKDTAPAIDTVLESAWTSAKKI